MMLSADFFFFDIDIEEATPKISFARATTSARESIADADKGYL